MGLLGGGFSPTRGLLSGYGQGGMGGWMPGVNVPFNIYSQVPPISPMMMQGTMPNVVSLGGQQGQGAQQSPNGHAPSLLGSWNQIFGQNQPLNPSTAAWVNPDTGLTASAAQWINPDTGLNAGGAGWNNPDTDLSAGGVGWGVHPGMGSTAAPVAAGSSGDSAGLAALLKLFMQ